MHQSMQGCHLNVLLSYQVIISGALCNLRNSSWTWYIPRNSSFKTLHYRLNGMAVTRFLASNSPIGIPFAALLYGVLSIAKSGMIGVPPEIIDVVSALIIFFVLLLTTSLDIGFRPRHKSVKLKEDRTNMDFITIIAPIAASVEILSTIDFHKYRWNFL